MKRDDVIYFNPIFVTLGDRINPFYSVLFKRENVKRLIRLDFADRSTIFITQAVHTRISVFTRPTPGPEPTWRGVVIHVLRLGKHFRFFDVHVYLGRINPFLHLTDAPHETDDRRSVFNSLV